VRLLDSSGGQPLSIARLGDMAAVAIADAIQLAALTFGGGRLRDDTVALVMKVPA
jgi:hypothetical protein